MSDMLYKRWLEMLEKKEGFALITVIKAKGSTPRGAGTKMLVDSLGRAIGTIGGGCPEAEAWQEAKLIASEGGYCLLDINLAHSGDIIKDGGEAMICGGRLQVFIEHIAPDSEKSRLLQAALDSVHRRGLKDIIGIVCLGVKEGEDSEELFPAPAMRFMYSRTEGLSGGAEEWNKAENADLKRRLTESAAEVEASGLPKLAEIEHNGRVLEFFIESFKPCRRFYIAGAGHVSRPLSAIANMCGFAVHVNDDRPEYADPKMFAEGVRVGSLPFKDFFAPERLQLDENCAVVLVTRGHKHDGECLRALIGCHVGYLGMIGSQRRTILIRERLLRDGVDPEWLAQVHAPIGLDIGGETPEEIAVAIMAEVIAEFNGASKALEAGLSVRLRSKLPDKADSRAFECPVSPQCN
ncbi:XdhC family protein [bacterium]|nr:XdhC family protein [bacterium]